MLEVKDMSFGYNSDKQVFRRLSIRLEEGRYYGLLGLNGIGKTTLLKILSSRLFPQSGSVYFDSKDLKVRELSLLNDVFMVPSDFKFPKISLRKYVELNSVFYPKFCSDIFYDCMNNFGLDTEIANLDKLSLGQKHILAACLAISLRVKLLMFDEATNGMDIPARKVFRKMLLKHTTEEQIVILSTHVVSDIENLLTDIIVLRKPHDVYISSLDEIQSRYSFGVEADSSSAIYSEPCSEGYRVIRHKEDNDIDDSEVSLDLLFNALTKGGIK